MKKNLLILSASYGSGHNVAATAMANYYKEKWYKIKIVDMVEFLEKSIWVTTQKYYQEFCQQYPLSWEITYNLLDNAVIKKILFGFRYPIFQKKFDTLIKEFEPGTIISFFPSWWWFIKKNIKRHWKKFRTGIVITDAISMHSIWYLEGSYIDNYFVIDEYSKEIFKQKFRHKKDNVTVSFFPIEEQYFIDKQKVENKKIVLVLSALEKDFALNLLSHLSKEKFDVTIIQGRNEALYETLNKLYWKKSQFRFVKYMNLKEHYKDIDIYIWKAGGATISECIATDTPIIVPDIIPGQESGNVELLMKSETGIYEDDPKKIIFYLTYLDFSRFLPNFAKLKQKKVCEMIYRKLSD